ncbi:MoxR family ATPase [bacterium]|nr:MoxR family ATPase [bacterium]
MKGGSVKEDYESIQKLGESVERIRAEIAKRIVGQEQVITEVLVTLLSGGHSLLIGVPGLAKTMLISTLAETLDLKFSRIQFTPDLMPSDITGTEVLEENRSTGERFFKFIAGPIFANIILADEINRTPPKTQAALLEAMQEHKVTAGDTTYKLDDPFFVLATQNPIEQEGTYPLPEAQLDRFMLNTYITYPSLKEEQDIVKRTTGPVEAKIDKVLSAEQVIKMQKLIRRVPVSDFVMEYAVKLVSATRPESTQFEYIKKWIRWGASPRASQFLILGGKAYAAMNGRPTPNIDDIRFLAKPVLRHRLIRTFSAEAEGITTDDIIDKLLSDIKG